MMSKLLIWVLAFLASFSFEARSAELLLFDCQYEWSVSANISKKLGIQTEQNKEKNFNLKFTVKPGAKTASFIGNLGASEVISIWSTDKVTFIEITGGGTVQTTVVYGVGLGRKASAHSRTTGGEGYEMPSQYYGFCNIR